MSITDLNTTSFDYNYIFLIFYPNETKASAMPRAVAYSETSD